VLDQALLRPGRFDRRVTVSAPDRGGREAILKVHTRGVPLAPDVDLTRIAASTPGMVGADLANLVNEAALLAARRSHDVVQESDFTDALERIILGAERQVMMTRPPIAVAPRITRAAMRSWGCSPRARTRCARSRSSRAGSRWA
jgi:cell division protease FtsH